MIVVKYDPNTNYINNLQTSGEASPDSTTLVFHDQNTSPSVLNTLYALANTIARKYLIVDSGVYREMTQAEKDQVDSDENAAQTAAAKAAAKALQDALDEQARAIRAVVKETVDELNILREWLMAFRSQVGLSTNLANFQTRVAALPDLPDRTYTQAKNAINSIIDNE